MNRAVRMKNGNGAKVLISYKSEVQGVSVAANNVEKGKLKVYCRWYNHLNPAIIKDKQLTKPEIDKLFQLQHKLCNRWANIAQQFPGRTDNNLKNFFYSSLRRAIRQINFFVAHYKKKSNIKPFKQSILTKILNISDQKYK